MITYLKKYLLNSKIVFCLITLALYLPTAIYAAKIKNSKEEISKNIVKLVQQGAVILSSPQKTILFEHNSNAKFIPASVLKIVVASAAFDLLGENFRFSTQFYLNKKNDILIKGGGDPFLISEEIEKIAKKLKAKGYNKFHSLYLDDSLIKTKRVPGLSNSNNAYDALNGALVVNFNSLFLGKDKQGEVFSAEKWTPLTPLAKTKASSIPNGAKKRINIGSNYQDSIRYTAELFQAIFKKEGLLFDLNDYHLSKLNQDWSLVLDYSNSRKLKELIPSFLLYSNNYISNQIYFKLGGIKYNTPYNLEKSNKAMASYLLQAGIPKQNFKLVEGSGLSRQNRFTAKSLLKILDRFAPYYRLLPMDEGAYIKTGTLTNVYNLAGYIPYKGKNYPFCIFINGNKNNRLEVLDFLKKWLALTV